MRQQLFSRLSLVLSFFRLLCGADPVAARSEGRRIAQASGYPTWGATALGAPALTTNVSAWLRIVKRNVIGLENCTAYSSADDVNWKQSGTWVHALGSGAKICLFAGNLAGYTATFDYIHVSTLQ